MELSARTLIKRITEAYLHQDEYSMQKLVPEFSINGKFLGDYFNYFIFEPLEANPPTIYHIGSPFDVISKKAPQQALVFNNGRLELNIDFTDYVDMRTGVMDALLLQSLGIENISSKKILLMGTGKVAQWSLRYLKEIYPELEQIDVKNLTGKYEDFMNHANSLNVKAFPQIRINLEIYDLIICHTNTNTPLFSAEQSDCIKKGAIITSYRTTADSGELPTNFIDSSKANIITDWEDSLTFVHDLRLALEAGSLQKQDIIYLKDQLVKNLHQDEKHYTVFRSTGTPMQNMAVLKELMHVGVKNKV